MITLEEAKKHQNQLQAQGQRFLDKVDILDRIQEFGEVVIVGSFKSGLMAKADIDIEVYSSARDRSLIASLCQELITDTEVVRLKFVSAEDIKTRPGQPTGTYIGLQFMFEEVLWNIDVWFMTEEGRVNPEVFGRGWEDRLTSAQHDTILLLKYQLKEMGLYPGTSKNKQSFGSADVYQAVMVDGVKELDELLQWGTEHPTYGKLINKT